MSQSLQRHLQTLDKLHASHTMARSSSTSRTLVASLLLATAGALQAPVAPRTAARSPAAALRSPTALQAYNDFDERGMRKFRWNMNVGREPWGFSLNAEVWNGRIAMLAFFWVLIQEAIVGKGSITVFQEAEHWWQLIVPSIIGGTFFVMVAFVTNTIASQDGDDFSTDEILAELTGEKPTTKAPAGQQEKGFELPAFELPKLPNPFE